MSASVEGLRLLGLTEYEARAYDALVGAGESTADAVAEAAAIPPTKVYSILDSLAGRGFVASDQARPRKYSAQRPADLFARHRARMDHRLDEAMNVLEARYIDRGEVHSGPFWLLKGSKALETRLRVLLPDARQQIMCLLPFPLAEVDKALFQLLAAAHDRGVRVRIMADPDQPEVASLARQTGAEVRMTRMPIRNVIVDRRHAVGTFVVPRGPGRLDTISMWIPVSEIVQQLEPAMRLLFDQAPPT